MVEVRGAGPNDVVALHAALLHAFNWEPSREPLSLDHPVLAPYRDGWGAPGDLGVVADGIGAAYCRLTRGYGFVDEQTPEVTVGVEPEWRGRGVGTALLEALIALAAENGFDRLSLSVEPTNPALRLYERLGWRAVGMDDGGSVVMLRTGPRTARGSRRRPSVPPA